MTDRSLELKVGAVLIAAFVVLGGFVLFLGDVSFERGTKIFVDYAFSGAVQPGAPVRVSGVKVGRVDDIQFLAGSTTAGGRPIQVRLVLFLQERARPVLHEGARFYVNTQGLIGEHYVEIVPSDTPGPPLSPNTIVRGVDPPRYDLLVQRVYDFLEGMSKLLNENQQVIEDLFRAGTDLARTLDGAIKDNKGDLGRTIKNAADATEEAADLLKKLNRAVGEDGSKVNATVDDVAAVAAMVRKDLPASLEKLRSALDAAQKLGDALSGVDKARIDAMVGKASSAMDRADKVLADAQAITGRVRAGAGTVGLLIQDDEIYDDLKELLRDLKQHPWKLVWKQ